MKTTEKLIEELSKDLKKVDRNFSPAVRMIVFLYGTFILSAIILYFKTPFIFKLQNISHMLEVFSMFIFINSFTYFSLESLVPGSNKTKSFILLMITTIFMILTLSYRMYQPQTYNVVRDYCEFEAVGISIITTLIGHIFLSKSEYAKNNLFSNFIFFALPLIATFFLHMTCRLTFTHVLTCHIISPLIVPLTYVITIKGNKSDEANIKQ